MGSTILKIEHTQLPENTSHARELQWCMEYRKRELERAGAMQSKAWAMHEQAIEMGEPYNVIQEMATCALMFDAIYSDAWEEWNTAQAEYLALFN